jgi:thiol-disulfide isomerase/thioredoxin
MKLLKITTAFILVLVGTFAQASTPAPSYTINGTISGLSDGTVLELIPASTHQNEKPVSTATITASKFTFKGTVPGPRFFLIKVKGFNGLFNVMVANTAITITAKAVLTDSYGSKIYVFNDVKVSGSPIHDLYLKKMAAKDSLTGYYEAYHVSGKDISDKIGEARGAKDSVKLDSLMKTAAWKSFEAEESAFFKKVESTYSDAVKNNKDSWWGPFMMLNTLSYFTPAEKKTFESLSPAAQKSYYGELVSKELYPKSFVGLQAPTVDAKSDENAKANIIKLASGHKYVLIDFWASWCAPCRKSIPALKQLYKEMSDKGLQIVSISIDKKEADWTKAIKEEQLPWPSFLDNGDTSAAWNIRTIPAMFLLDEKGVVVSENMSLEEIIAKIKSK